MADSLAWRSAPITTLTVRQFLGGKAVRVVAVLSLVPCVFAGIYLLNTDVATPRDALVDLFQELLVAPTLLPITVLILATAALGNEVEDRTLPYLTMKPIGRLRIVLEKLFGVLLIALPTVLFGLALTTLIVAQGREDYARLAIRSPEAIDVVPVMWAMLGAAAAGVVAISAIFLAVSLLVPRALLAGIIYTFTWESLLGRYLPGVRLISIRHYVQSIFVNILDDPNVTLDNATSLQGSLITLGVASIIALALATWRLRRMNLE
jgi:ABC-2 type transport system permease protein